MCVEISDVLTILVKYISSLWDIAVCDSLFPPSLPRVTHRQSIAVIARGQMETVCGCCFGYAVKQHLRTVKKGLNCISSILTLIYTFEQF